MRKFIQLPDHRNYKYDGRYNHILDFIIRYKTQNDGAGPTIREIGAACHVSSTSVVNYAIDRLLYSGLIYVTPNGHIGVRGGMWTMMETKAVDPAPLDEEELITFEPRPPFEVAAQALERE